MTDPRSQPDDRSTASPWPFLLAVGLVVSEIAVWFGLVPIAVGGLVLVAGSVAGFIAESSKALSPWPIAAGLGLLFLSGGTFLYALGTGVLAVGETDVLVGLAARGFAIAVAGVIVLLGAVVGRYWAGRA